MSQPTLHVMAQRIAEQARDGANDETIMMLCDAAAEAHEVSTEYVYNLANEYAAGLNAERSENS